jgi:hypothetical protein
MRNDTVRLGISQLFRDDAFKVVVERELEQFPSSPLNRQYQDKAADLSDRMLSRLRRRSLRAKERRSAPEHRRSKAA